MFHYHDNPKMMRQTQVRASATDRSRAILLQIVDGSLAAVIFVVPFVMGGRHPLGQLMLATLTVITVLAWAIRQSLRPRPVLRPTWALALIAAGAILLVIQSLPLSQPLLEKLAPHYAGILPLWNARQSASAVLGPWSFISFTPADTRASLVMFLTYGLLFFVVVQRIKIIEDVERLLRWCAVSVVCMATFGLLQYLAGNGKFFWFYNHPFSSTFDGVKGSFTNKNHFAHFLALGVGPLIWWLLHLHRRTWAYTHVVGAIPTFSRDRAPTYSRSESAIFNHSNELKTYLLALALAIVLFAGLMSLSRGGMTALLLAAVVSSAACYWAATNSGRFLGILLAACVLIGAALSIFGLDNVGRRLESLTSAPANQKERFGGRLPIWTATANATTNFIWLGTGAGSFREVYPMYDTGDFNNDVEFTHAENSYLQVLLETGAIGLGLLLAGIAMWSYWCVTGWKGPLRIKICAGAIAGSLAAGAGQALVDYVWYVPACTAIMAVLAACALRISQFAAPEPSAAQPVPMRRLFPVAAAIALVPIGAWMIQNRSGPAIAESYWNQYLIGLKVKLSEPPLADNADPTAKRKAIDAAAQTEMKLIDCLQKTAYWQPTHASAQLALAEAHLRLFDMLQTTSVNPMPLANIRDAALESDFSSQQALRDWLAQALGDHWVHLDAAFLHTRQALLLSPLQGRGYLYLAKLCFLDGTKGLSKQACITQALRVRPRDGAVLYAAAAEAFLAGDPQHWLELSKQAFQCGRDYQRQLMANLVGNTPPEGIPAMIDFIINQFKPDLEALQYLYAVCAKRAGPEELMPLCEYQAFRAEFEASNRNDTKTTAIWLEAQRLHTQLKNGERALQCARRALICDGNNYNVHYQLALCLMDQGLFAEAESHLHWCLQRNGRDKAVENKLKDALKGRLDKERCAAAQKGDNF